MPMNFLQLLQDSWNFIRNRTQFSLIAMGLLVAIQVLVLFAVPSSTISPEASTNVMLTSLLIGIANIYVSLLLIFNIKSINLGQYQSFFQNSVNALRKLLPAIGLYILMVLPLSFAMSSILFSSVTGGGVSIISLPLFIMGIFIFIKLCLSIYVYVIEEDGFMQAVKFTWRFTKGKMFYVAMYSLLANLLPPLLTTLISNIGGGAMIISFVISAFLALFTTIFGFRFYQTLRQMPEK